jgi:hypothetical protein
MMLFTYINENINRVKTDIKAGIIPCSVLRYWEIYARYDALIKMGNSNVTARFIASEQYKINESTVFRIVKKMETTV